MPGKKDFVSVIKDGTCLHVQKQLVLCNLGEAYCDFKEKFPFRLTAVSCGAKVADFISITEPSKLVQKAIGRPNTT